MPETLTDFELASIDVKSTPEVPLVNTESRFPEQSEYVNTPIGRVFVTIQGDRSKPAFVTYHDLGLNSITQFHGFFNFSDMEPIMDSFCAYHINAPGQEESSDLLPLNYVYPTCEQLAESVHCIFQHFKLKNVVCIGIGLGANVLARYALKYPDDLSGLVLINCVSTKCGWIEWAYQKWNRWYLSSGQFTAFTQNYLLWHHFGYQTWETHHDLIQTYSKILTKGIHPYNLSLLVDSYINRTDLGIQRDDTDENGSRTTFQKTFNISCQVMNIVGDNSPHLDDVVDTNGRLNPVNSSFVKYSDCGGMVLEEQPAKFSESTRYFLQGLGFVTHLSMMRHSLANRHSKQAIAQKQILAQRSFDDTNAQKHQALDFDDLVSNN